MKTAETGVPMNSNPVASEPQVPEGDCSVRLSERDEAQVMAAAEVPPVPNEAALQAARRFLERHGSGTD